MKKKITLLIFLLSVTFSITQARQRVSKENGNVKGIVKDPQGLALPGVSVKIKGTTLGTSTGADGRYSISAAPEATLVFTSIGFVTQEQPVKNRTEINITMVDENTRLTEVVVIGYGTAAKKDVTGAVSSVKASQLENENPQSVADILRGNIPGLSVGFNTSAKGGGDLLVRGKTTLGRPNTNVGTVGTSTSPLIVLDGVIYNGQLSDINPNDIESVDVLKDASSLAVYGAKAATGVVAVTTKKGRNSTPTITINTNVGMASLSKDQDVYDGPGFLAWRADAGRLGAAANTPAYYFYSDPNNLPEGVTLEQWRGTSTGDPVDVWLGRLGLTANEKANYLAGKTENWYDRLFRTGLRQDHTLSISGRKDDVNYYMSVGYLKNENLIEGGDFSTARARLNLEAKAAKFLTVGMNLQFADRDEGAIEAGWDQLTNLSPYGDFYNADGSLRRIPTDDNGLNARNPFLDLTYNHRLNKQSTLFGSVFAKASLPFGITYQFNFSPGYDNYRYFDHVSSKNPNTAVGGESAYRENETRYNWQIDNLLKWNKTLGKIHNVDITLLANAEKYQRWKTRVTATGFAPNDDLSYSNMLSGRVITLDPNNNYDQVYTADALMARLNYTLKQRYLLTLSVRRDGFSAFGQDKPRATFPAAAIGWVFTEEGFLKNTSNWLSYGKLRLSYGLNGNRDIRDYQNNIEPYVALAALNAGKGAQAGPAGAIEVNTLSISDRLGNTGLQWEKTSSLNAGLDFSFIHDRIGGSIDVYKKKTSDLLISQTLSSFTGYTSVMSNLARVNNTGFELGLNSKNLRTRNLTWNTAFNFSLNRNKILALAGSDNPGNGWFIGEDIDVIWEYKILGVWQLNEMEEAVKYTKAGIKAGDFKLQDVNGDYQYNDSDKQFTGFKNPRYNWSLRNDFNLYKNFDFSFQILSSWGQQSQNNQRKNQPGSVGFGRTSSYVQPYWTPENPVNDYARLGSGLSGVSFNVWQKSSFIRLNTVALAYNIPASLLRRAKVQSAKLYVNVANAALYAPDWDYWDPQNAGPTPRYYTLGLNVSI